MNTQRAGRVPRISLDVVIYMQRAGPDDHLYVLNTAHNLNIRNVARTASMYNALY